ncbi:hypothetical protein QMK17_19480 [Rhodococcus sp. G-MC3]|uniref:hypothetical protein n=1 Tax=Rhodococcus sp. G-MC3 TaxID=3046209 RepID=UPI0024B9E6C2|nr:hypothetical protein [Rhodococcus sp. G-MC3]MDJ0395506.1 hypothetical protein [Rhodococcus sp. G-MC3]
MVNDQPSGAGGHDPQQGGNPDLGGFTQPTNYQSSQSNYPPPGAYPPGSFLPPAGNFTQYPQQDPWGYTGPPMNAAPAALRAGEAIKYGWKKFVANIGVWLGFMGLYAAVLVVLYIIAIVVVLTALFSSSALENSSYGAEFDNAGVTWSVTIGTAAIGVVGYFAGAVLVRGSLLELDGLRPHFGSFWRLRNVGNIAISAVLLSVVNAATSLLDNYFFSIAIGLVIGIMFWFVLQLLLDRGLAFHTAVITNASLIARAPVQLALLFLALAAINVVGAIPCGLGLIFTVPMSLIAMTYAYRVLSGGFVSPAT